MINHIDYDRIRTCRYSLRKGTTEMSAEQQTKILADYILQETLHLPQPHEGAGDTAVRLLKNYQLALQTIIDELGVPGDSYPMPAVNAYEAARGALGIQD